MHRRVSFCNDGSSRATWEIIKSAMLGKLLKIAPLREVKLFYVPSSPPRIDERGLGARQ